MDDLNRVPLQHLRAPSHRIAILAIAVIAWSHLGGYVQAQEPRKPSWIPFPMGRAAGNFSPARANPKPEPAQPNTPEPNANPASSVASNTSQGDPNRPAAWLIWADPLAPNTQQPGDCYFRRTMELPEVERCFVDIDCQARTEVYFNGQRVRPAKAATGKQRIDLQQAVRPGQNVLAIAVQSPGQSAPGVRAEFYFKPKQGNWRLVVSDSDWKASKGAPRNWQTLGFNDGSWSEAVDLNATSASAANLAMNPQATTRPDQDRASS